MFLVFIVARSMHQQVTKCLKIRKAYYLENIHFVTNTVLKEGYIMGHNLLRQHHLAYITISILMKHSIMIRYSITVVIYCHIDKHCRSLLSVPKYFSSQYPNNANPSKFSTADKLHYMLCSCVRVFVTN